MEPSKKSLIYRNLLFWLGGGTITDPEKVLNQIALDCDATRDEVWDVYTEMLDVVLYRAV